jgi:hypothetical protein
MTAANKTNDDYVVDDNMETHKKKRRHAEKDERRAKSKQVAGKLFYWAINSLLKKYFITFYINIRGILMGYSGKGI